METSGLMFLAGFAWGWWLRTQDVKPERPLPPPWKLELVDDLLNRVNRLRANMRFAGIDEHSEWRTTATFTIERKGQPPVYITLSNRELVP